MTLTRTQAATQAGISPIEMITEPEAASLYTLMSVKDKGLQVRDAFRLVYPAPRGPP